MHIQDMVGNKTWIFELKVIPECMGLYFHQQDIEKHFLFFRWMNISIKLTWSITAVLFVDFIGSLFIAHFVFVLYHNRIRFFVFIFFKIKVEDFQQQKRKKKRNCHIHIVYSHPIESHFLQIRISLLSNIV